nr:retinal rod rhodopsin-sensitive cGMP 3',5'-cyclic phosphodiesterase subunit gamma isoform X2 [Zootoca vivipara]
MEVQLAVHRNTRHHWSVILFPSSFLHNRLNRRNRKPFCVPRRFLFTAAMSLEPPKPEIKSATRVTGGPATPRKGPPKFKQRQTRQFKSKPPKKGVQGFGDDIPGMEGLGTDITVICPWEAFSHLELHELAQYGII